MALNAPKSGRNLEVFNRRLKDGVEATNNFVGMLYGGPGVGKTTLALHIACEISPPEKPILFIQTSGSFDVIKNHPDIDPRRFRVLNYADKADLDFVSNNWGELNFGCVIYDEVSMMVEYDTLDVTKNRAAGNSDKDPEQPVLPDFFVTVNRFALSLLFMTKIDGHRIYVSHSREAQDEKKRFITRPDLPPKASAKLIQQMSFVGHMSATNSSGGQYIRRVSSWPTEKVIAKSRIGTIPQVTNPEGVVLGVSTWLQKGGVLLPDTELPEVTHYRPETDEYPEGED